MGQVLLALILLPLAAALPVGLLGARSASAARWLTLAVSAAVFALVLFVAVRFQPRTVDESNAPPLHQIMQPQMTLTHHWFTIPYYSGGEEKAAQIEFRLGVDGLGLWLLGLTALLTIAAVLVSWESVVDRVAEFHVMLLLLETGMLGVFCAFDVILFYVFFEFTLVPLFFLIGVWGGPERRYAARKFFIYTLAGSVVTLVALVALVLTLHFRGEGPLTFSLPDLAQQMELEMWRCRADAERLAYWRQVQALIFLGLFVGFAIKVPLVPFHTWLPLAHTEAPTAGSVLLAGVLLKLGTYGFLRVALPILPIASMEIGVSLIAGLAVVGIIYGALCALAQTDVKKLVAYSSVSHMGFCMLGMFALNSEGLSGSVLQMVNHGLITGGLFMVVGMMYERYHTRRLEEIGGLAARLPRLAFFTVFLCLASIGLPGLNGFVGEVLALIGMFKARPFYAVVGAMGIVLGAWYLLTMVQRGFFGPLREPAHAHGPIRDLKPREWAALAPIAVLCVGIGFYPKPFLQAIRPEVRAIERLYSPPVWQTPTRAGGAVAAG